MSFKKFALVTLVATSALAASPANASYAGFHFLQDSRHTPDNTGNHDSDHHDGDQCQGWNCQSDGPPSQDSNGNNQDGAAVFQLASPRDTLVSGVPEPATWAMFLLGFGGIGFMLRGVRRKQAGIVPSV